MERINSKIHAAVWVIVAVVVAHFTDIFNVAMHSEEINRFGRYNISIMNVTKAVMCINLLLFCHLAVFHRICLNLAIVLITANIGIMLYLTLWLPLIEKITVPWDVYCPSMIPISTGLGVSSIVLLIITFWPIWGLLSPLILFILVFGVLFSTHFIPWPC